MGAVEGCWPQGRWPVSAGGALCAGRSRCKDTVTTGGCRAEGRNSTSHVSATRRMHVQDLSSRKTLNCPFHRVEMPSDAGRNVWGPQPCLAPTPKAERPLGVDDARATRTEVFCLENGRWVILLCHVFHRNRAKGGPALPHYQAAVLQLMTCHRMDESAIAWTRGSRCSICNYRHPRHHTFTRAIVECLTTRILLLLCSRSAANKPRMLVAKAAELKRFQNS